MKTFFIVGLLLTLASCDPKDPSNCTSSPTVGAEETTTDSCTTTPANPETPAEDPTEDPTEDPADPSGPSDPVPSPSEDIPAEAFLFEAKFSLTKFDSADKAKIEKAIAIIKKVVRTKEFKDRVINFKYKGYNEFVDSSMSPEQVYQALLEGSEELSPGVNHQMDLDLELYYSSKNTVGYTYASGLRIWMNTKYFDAYTPAEVAGNIFHEWSHKLGFKHAVSYSVSRNSSVPYALGYLMEELGKQYE